jgi:hypothetical protein
MDGAAQIIWATPSGEPDGEWLWDRLNTGSSQGVPGTPVLFNMALGQHTLVLVEREAGTRIDGLVVAPSSQPTPVTETIVLAGETTSSQVLMALNLLGDVRMEVQSVLVDSSGEKTSVFAKSTDPQAATVNGVAKGWLVSVALNTPSNVVMETVLQ